MRPADYVREITALQAQLEHVGTGAGPEGFTLAELEQAGRIQLRLEAAQRHLAALRAVEGAC